MTLPLMEKLRKVPEKMEVIYEDGTIKDSEIVWDQVDEESYAHAGNFTVNGNSTVVLNAEKKAEQEG